MSIWAIIATGPSLNDNEISEIKRFREDGLITGVIAVNNAGLDKAPWADALVAHDSLWWAAYPEAINFRGRKFSKHRVVGVERAPCFLATCNSGLLAMFVARDIFLSNKIILFGFDFKGSHYFGPHTAKVGNQHLRNTTEERFRIHIRQFDVFKGCDVLNFNPDSALERFPKVKFNDIFK